MDFPALSWFLALNSLPSLRCHSSSFGYYCCCYLVGCCCEAMVAMLCRIHLSLKSSLDLAGPRNPAPFFPELNSASTAASTSPDPPPRIDLSLNGRLDPVARALLANLAGPPSQASQARPTSPATLNLTKRRSAADLHRSPPKFV
jgi:hypothetical protein